MDLTTELACAYLVLISSPYSRRPALNHCYPWTHRSFCMRSARYSDMHCNQPTGAYATSITSNAGATPVLSPSKQKVRARICPERHQTPIAWRMLQRDILLGDPPQLSIPAAEARKSSNGVLMSPLFSRTIATVFFDSTCEFQRLAELNGPGLRKSLSQVPAMVCRVRMIPMSYATRHHSQGGRSSLHGSHHPNILG